MIKQKKYWSVKEILSWTSAKFTSENIPSPLLDAQILLCHALKFNSRIDLYLKSEQILKQNELDLLRSYIKRRLSHEPVAYIIQQKYWCNLDLYVDKNVLIPRPETETMFDFVLAKIKQISITPKIIFDFCTGSGCLAIAFAKKFPDAKIFAFDISHDALTIAKKNAVRNQANNIEYIDIDLQNPSTYEYIQNELPKADIIIANPPYVSPHEWENLPIEVKNYEPKISLIAENNGLSLGQTVFENINKFNLLKNNSIFAMELAHKQPETLLSSQVEKKIFSAKLSYLEKPFNEWFILKDLENKERFLIKIYQ